MIKNGRAWSGRDALLHAAGRFGTAFAWLLVLLGVSAAHAQVSWVDKAGHDTTADRFAAEEIFSSLSQDRDRPYTGITWYRDYGSCQLIVGLTSQLIEVVAPDGLTAFSNRPDQLFELRGFYNNGKTPTGTGRYVRASGKTAIRIKFKNGVLPNFLNAAVNVNNNYEAFVATIQLTIRAATGQPARCSQANGISPEYKVTILPLYSGGDESSSQKPIASNTTDAQRGNRGWNGYETGIVIQRNLFYALPFGRWGQLQWCSDGVVVSWVQRPSFLSFRKDSGTYTRIGGNPPSSRRDWQNGPVSAGNVTMVVQSYFLPTEKVEVVFNRKPDNGKHEFAVAVQGRCGNAQQQAILRYTLDIYANHRWGQGPDNVNRVPIFDTAALSQSLGSAAVDTGLRIHHSTSTCSQTDVVVHSDSQSNFILRKRIQRFRVGYGQAERAWTWEGGANLSIRANMGHFKIDNDNEGQKEVAGVHFKSDFNAAPGVYRPKFVLSAPGCEGAVVSTTLTYTVTVADTTARRGSWETGSWKIALRDTQTTITSVADTAGGSARFYVGNITASAHPHGVGFLINRSSRGCLFTDLELKNHTSIFEINQVRTGTTVTSSGRSTRTAMVMNDNQHAGVYFRPGVNYVAPDTYLLTVVATQSETLCTGVAATELPPPLTLRFRVVVSSTRPWETVGLNSGASRAAFPAGAIAQLTVAVDTGIRVQRSSAGCRDTDVTLAAGTATHFQLAHINSLGRQVGNAAAGIEDVPMRVTGGSHVQVQFKPRANVPVGVFRVSVVLKPSQRLCGTQQGLPAALSLSYLLNMVSGSDLAPAIAASRDRVAFMEGVAVRAAATVAVMTVTDDFDTTSPVISLDAAASLFEVASVRSWNGTVRVDAVRLKSGTRLSYLTKPQHTISFFATDGGDSSLSTKQDITIEVVDPNDMPPSISSDLSFAVVDENQTTPIATVTIRDEGDDLPGIRIEGEGADQFELDYQVSDWSSSSTGMAATLKIKSGTRLSRSTKGSYTLRIAVVDSNNQSFRAAAAIEIIVTEPGPPRLTLPAATVIITGYVDQAATTTRIFAGNVIASDNKLPTLALGGSDASAFELIQTSPPWRGVLTAGIYLRSGISLNFETKRAYTVGISATETGSNTESLVVILANPRKQPPVSIAATVGTEVGSQGIRLAGMHGIDSILSRPAASGPGALAFLEMLANKEHELESGEIDLREFLDGQSFAMPLMNANGVASRFGMWLQAEQTKLEKDSSTVLNYEANAFNANLGFDVLLGDFFTLGVGYGVHQLDTDYTDFTRCQGLDFACEGQKGTYELELQIAQPYMALDVGGGRLALAMGLGQGEVKVMDAADDSNEEFKRDADYTSYAVGINHKLGTVNQFRMRAVMSNSQVDIEELCVKDSNGRCTKDSGGNDVLEPEMDFSGGNLRVGLGYAREISFDASRFLQPSIEFAYSSDWGDGDTGSLYGGGAGLEYRGGRMQVDSTFRYMTGEDINVYGAALGLRLNPSAGSLGLGLEANPSYDLRGNNHDLLNDSVELNEAALPEHGLGLRSRMAVSYGFAIAGGVLTPYGGYEMITSSDARRELGLRLATSGQRRWLLGWSADAAGDEALKIEYQLGE